MKSNVFFELYFRKFVNAFFFILIPNAHTLEVNWSKNDCAPPTTVEFANLWRGLLHMILQFPLQHIGVAMNLPLLPLQIYLLVSMTIFI